MEEGKEERKEGLKFKTASDLKGVQNLKSVAGKRIRSIPSREDTYYLDLYLLQKNRDRLESEMRWVNTRERGGRERVQAVQKEIADMEKKMLKKLSSLQGSPHSQPEEKEEAKSYKHEGKKWSKMVLGY